MAHVEGAPAHGAVAHLLPQTYKRMVASWLEEDTPSMDYGGFVVGEDMAEARLLGKSKVRFLVVVICNILFLESGSFRLSCVSAHMTREVFFRLFSCLDPE